MEQTFDCFNDWGSDGIAMSTLTRLSFDSRPATGANETYFIGLVARTFYYRTDQGRGPQPSVPRTTFQATGATSRLLTFRVKLPVGGVRSLKALSNIRHISGDSKIIASVL
jgi:hypothetical protein